MKKLFIDGSHSGPKIDLNPDTGIFLLEGRSILEDAAEFYSIIYDWVNEYFLAPQKKTKVIFKFEYLNSSSTKYITVFLRIFEKKAIEGVGIEIDWYYEKDDESILEIGQNYKSNLKLKINLISID